MHPHTNIQWFTKKCAKTKSFAQLTPIALDELQKFSDGAEIVCGPISTGGRGSVAENLKVFNAAIAALLRNGRPIWSQMPYENRIFLFRKWWRAEDPSRAGHYYMPILEEFYRPLMQSGLIKKAYFIPNWESSFGTCFERQELMALGIEICDLSEAWIEDALSAE